MAAPRGSIRSRKGKSLTKTCGRQKITITPIKFGRARFAIKSSSGAYTHAVTMADAKKIAKSLCSGGLGYPSPSRLGRRSPGLPNDKGQLDTWEARAARRDPEFYYTTPMTWDEILTARRKKRKQRRK